VSLGLIDDIGLLSVTAETAEALYRVVDAAYEKRSSRSPATCTRPGSTNS
jgi:DNA replication protein DnaC